MPAHEELDRERIDRLLRSLGDVERFVSHLLDDRKSWDEWLLSYTEYRGKLDRAVADLDYLENIVLRGTNGERPLRDRVTTIESNHARHLDDCCHRQEENDDEHSRLDGELRRIEGTCSSAGKRLDGEIARIEGAYRAATASAVKQELDNFREGRKTLRDRAWEIATYLLVGAVGAAIERAFGVVFHAPHP